MPHKQHVIIGGGMTAAAAMDGIREGDATGAIGLISAELDAPYDRRPLSKALWKGTALDSIRRKTEDKGKGFTYQTLLLATGGRPRRLPFGDDQIMYFHTLSDYRRLRALTETGQRFAMIGGGCIGSEIAATLALMKGRGSTCRTCALLLNL